MNGRISLLLAAASALIALPAMAGTVTLIPVQDNTLYEVQPGAADGNGSIPSNGAGQYFFTGTTLIGEFRRGLVAFDVAGSLPAGVTVTEVTLTLQMSRTISGAETVGLHRVLSDWGEGTSDAPGEEGQGTAATTGDATWLHTFFDSSFWGAPGGDFSGAASATQSVGGNGAYTWGSTAAMVGDVQAWLDSPSTNFGWLVLGNEAAAATAKRFNTRENSVGQPQLTVLYEEGVPTLPLWMLGLLGAALIVVTLWQLRSRSQPAA